MLAFARICHVLVFINYLQVKSSKNWRQKIWETKTQLRVLHSFLKDKFAIPQHADLGTQYVSKPVLMAFKVGSVPKASKRASSVKIDILQTTKCQYLKLGPRFLFWFSRQ